MSDTLKGYQALIAAAQKLANQAQTDKDIADRLVSNPAKAISEEAGEPLPKGVRLKFEQGADGKSLVLKPEVDPAFSGELDDRLLEAVAGGKGASTAASMGLAVGGAAAGIMMGIPVFGGLAQGAYAMHQVNQLKPR